MFRKGGRSLIVLGVLGVLIFVAVSMFFAGLANDQDVVVAKVPLSAGTRLSPDVLEVRHINASAALPGAFSNVNDLKGQLLVSARMPGDQITQEMVGNQAISAIAAALPAGEVAVAIKVTQDTGLAGIVRVGDLVGAVGIVSAQDLGLQQQTFNASAFATPVANSVVDPALRSGVVNATPVARATPTPALPEGVSARVVLNNLQVLVVPQSFRYEETAPDASGDTYTQVRTSTTQQQNSVIVVAVPVAPVQIAAGYSISPVEFLALLNNKGTVHFFLESTAKAPAVETDGVNAKTLLERFYANK